MAIIPLELKKVNPDSNIFSKKCETNQTVIYFQKNVKLTRQ